MSAILFLAPVLLVLALAQEPERPRGVSGEYIDLGTSLILDPPPRDGDKP